MTTVTGMILADNGSPWYVTGASDPRFNDDVMHWIKWPPKSRLTTVTAS